MERKYSTFTDLPPEVVKRLKKRLNDAESEHRLPENPPPQDFERYLQECRKDRSYSEGELEQIVDSFVRFNNAVMGGLPNQIYQMMIKSLDVDLAKRAYAAYLIWCGYEGIDTAKDFVKGFADMVNGELDKRANWSLDDFNREKRSQ